MHVLDNFGKDITSQQQNVLSSVIGRTAQGDFIIVGTSESNDVDISQAEQPYSSTWD